MGFWTLMFGIYGGGPVETPAVQPNDGWIASKADRVWVAPAKQETGQ